MTSRKFIVITNSEAIIKNVKAISSGYWTLNSTVIFFYYDEEEIDDLGNFRDKIKGTADGSIALMEIKTCGNAAARGIYAVEKTWNWIKDFNTDDVEELEKKAVENYKNQISLSTENTEIKPTIEINSTDIKI